jgi:peptide/nickel transport system ATP-binding protein
VSKPLLRIEDLRLEFKRPWGVTQILRGIDLRIHEAEVLGIVGESGCGKTMTGRTVLGLQPQSARISGHVWFDGSDLLTLDLAELRRLRGRRIAMVFQDPSAALNPVFTIGAQLLAVLRYHRIATGNAATSRAIGLLEEVGLPDPEGSLSRYPHELSGGMQQRAMVAIALAASPQLLIADEPTTALDVTVEAEILSLLLRLRETHGIAIMLISHNLRALRRTCDNISVLYAGTVVEEGPTRDVLEQPRHPYTQALLAALPTPERRHQPLAVIPGQVPSGREPIDGCLFAARCPYAMPVCETQSPPQFSDSAVSAACWLLSKERAAG